MAIPEHAEVAFDHCEELVRPEVGGQSEPLFGLQPQKLLSEGEINGQLDMPESCSDYPLISKTESTTLVNLEIVIAGTHVDNILSESNIENDMRTCLGMKR
jgi:hypothetical protein